MRRTFWLAVLFVIGCGVGNTPHSGYSISAPLQKLSLVNPSGWTHSFSPDSLKPSALLTLQSPLESDTDDYQENMSIYHEVLPMRIDDSIYHQSAITEIKLMNAGLEVANLGVLQVGNNKFRSYTFQFEREKEHYTVKGYTYLKDSVGYHFNFTAAGEGKKKFEREIEHVLSTFKPL
jgi:hypothetical protein